MLFKSFYSVLLCLLPLSVFSQLRIEGELRPRLMVDNGYSTPKPADARTNAYVSQRTRINAQFESEYLETFISIQDIRFWGGDDNFKSSGIFGNTESLNLHQGWFRLKPVSWISVKVGRQLLSYDDQRIISTRGWNDYQVTYDAVLIKGGNSVNSLDLGLSWNSESSKYTILSPYKFRTFDFLRYEWKSDLVTCSAIGLLTGNSETDTTDNIRYRLTGGFNFKFAGDLLSSRISTYYQHNLNEYGGKTSAFCFSFDIGRELIVDRLSLNAGIDYLSGQDEVKSEAVYRSTDHSFDILYGRRHAYYGYMDYFSTTPEQGLEDYMLKAEYRIIEDLVLNLDYHYFRLATRMLDPGTIDDVLARELGHELDMVITWQPLKEISFQAGYSIFVTSPTLEVMKGVRNTGIKFPRFTYLMITVKPMFLFKNIS